MKNLNLAISLIACAAFGACGGGKSLGTENADAMTGDDAPSRSGSQGEGGAKPSAGGGGASFAETPTDGGIAGGGSGGSGAMGGNTAVGGSAGSGGRGAGSVDARSDGSAGTDGAPAMTMRDGGPTPVPPAIFPDGGARLEPAPTPTMDVVDTCGRYAEVYCGKYAACLPVAFATGFGNSSDCRRLVDTSCRRQLSLPGTGETPMRIESCADAITIQMCDTWVFGLPAACTTAPPGRLRGGDVCNADGQCETDHFCNRPTTQTAPGTFTSESCGVCTRRTGPGSACGNGQFACQIGLSCLFSGSGGTCIAPKRTGDACTVADICGGGRCSNGNCVARPVEGAGADCRLENNCDLQQDLYCNRLSFKCERRPLPAKLGGYCGALYDGSAGFVDCEAGSACTGLAEGGFARTCVALAELSQACSTTGLNARRCKPGLVCVTNQCAEPDQRICR